MGITYLYPHVSQVPFFLRNLVVYLEPSQSQVIAGPDSLMISVISQAHQLVSASLSPSLWVQIQSGLHKKSIHF